MTERSELLERISAIIADYRVLDGVANGPSHVENWISQFDNAVQLPILAEMSHVLAKTYITRTAAENFLNSVFASEKLAGGSPCTFWQSVEILTIQQGGSSQRHMVELFRSILEKQCGSGAGKFKAGEGGTFLYLDDAIFSGNRVRRDFEAWIQNHAPQACTVHVVLMALHRGGQYYARSKIETAARAAGKSISLKWWRMVELEDRKSSTNTSDVLRPVSIPPSPDVAQYVQGLRFPPHLRIAGNTGENGIFSSEAGRHLLEQEFLKAGVHIRAICPNLGVAQRPLGNTPLETLGFGSMLVTYRNCPNNVPLALWAGDPWYPLFARTTNADSSLQRFIENLRKG